jgi:hypothetical protein
MRNTDPAITRPIEYFENNKIPDAISTSETATAIGSTVAERQSTLAAKYACNPSGQIRLAPPP